MQVENPVVDRTDVRTLEDLAVKFTQMSANCAKILQKAPGYTATSHGVREMMAIADVQLAAVMKLKNTSLTDIPDVTLRPEAVKGHKLPVRVFIEEIKDLPAMLDSISLYCKHDPTALNLFIDTEGNALDESLTWFQINLHAANIVYVLDMLALGSAAFTTPSKNGTLKDILESSTIRKAFFGAVGDSNTLFRIYGIRIACIDDLALMNLATERKRDRTPGLAQCVGCKCQGWFTAVELAHFRELKEWGKKEFGDTCTKVEELRDSGKLEETEYTPVFNQRPALEKVKEYCVWDVLIMPMLYDRLSESLERTTKPFKKLDDLVWKEKSPEKWVELMARKAELGCETWEGLIQKKTLEQLELSQSLAYDGKYVPGMPEWAGLS